MIHLMNTASFTGNPPYSIPSYWSSLQAGESLKRGANARRPHRTPWASSEPVRIGPGFAGAALQRGALRLRPGCWLGPARLAGAVAKADGSARPRKSERVERFEHLTRSRRAHGRRKCRRGTHRDKLPWVSARHGAQRDRLAGDALESRCTAWQTARRDRQPDATAGSGP